MNSVRNINIERFIENYNARQSPGVMVISEKVFKQTLGEISNYIINQNRADEAIRALKQIYYDGIAPMEVVYGLEGITRNTISQALVKSFSKVMEGLHKELQEGYYQYKKIQLKTLWLSGGIIVYVETRGENLEDWCSWRSIFLI